MDGFLVEIPEIPIKMDDLGVPLFSETPVPILAGQPTLFP